MQENRRIYNRIKNLKIKGMAVSMNDRQLN